jgi:GNAT superfamily N-acetyltransferase
MTSSSIKPSSTTVQVELLTSVPPQDQLAALVQLVNDAYDVAEDGMWKVKGFRTTLPEMVSIIQEGRLIVAKRHTTLNEADVNDDAHDATKEYPMVGCVKVERLKEHQEPQQQPVGEWGMLVVDPTLRGQGIGRQLVLAAEGWAKQQGCVQVQLELLTPRTWKHSFKEYAREWYLRLGYVALRTEPFEGDYGHLVDYLATPCDFTIYRKALVVLLP